MKKIINKMIYDTDMAWEVCRNLQNDSDLTRKNVLYKTRKGNFFIHTISQISTRNDFIIPYSEDKAIEFYEQSSEATMTFKEAFPDCGIEEA